MVRIAAFQAVDPGSNPGWRITFLSKAKFVSAFSSILIHSTLLGSELNTDRHQELMKDLLMIRNYERQGLVKTGTYQGIVDIKVVTFLDRQFI